MKEHVLPYELAFKLRQLGFRDQCFYYYHASNTSEVLHINRSSDMSNPFGTPTPFYEQAFAWLLSTASKDMVFDNIILELPHYHLIGRFDEYNFDNIKIASGKIECIEVLIKICDGSFIYKFIKENK